MIWKLFLSLIFFIFFVSLHINKSSYSIVILMLIIVFSCFFLFSLNIEFLVFIFLLLYIGAISIIFIFVSMLLQVEKEVSLPTFFFKPNFKVIIVYLVLFKILNFLIYFNKILIGKLHIISTFFDTPFRVYFFFWQQGSNSNKDITFFIGLYTQKQFFFIVLLVTLLFCIVSCISLCLRRTENSQYVVYVNNEFFFLSIYILVSLVLTIFLYLISFLVALKIKDIEKKSSFECGFEPFKSACNYSLLPFYLYGIIFLIFEIEIPLGFAGVCYVGSLSYQEILILDLLLFFMTLTIELEIKRGVLDE